MSTVLGPIIMAALAAADALRPFSEKPALELGEFCASLLRILVLPTPSPRALCKASPHADAMGAAPQHTDAKSAAPQHADAKSAASPHPQMSHAQIANLDSAVKEVTLHLKTLVGEFVAQDVASCKTLANACAELVLSVGQLKDSGKSLLARHTSIAVGRMFREVAAQR